MMVYAILVHFEFFIEGNDNEPWNWLIPDWFRPGQGSPTGMLQMSIC